MGFSRREFLAGCAAFGAAVGFNACQNNSNPVAQNLPEFEPEGIPVPEPVVPAGPPSLPPPTVKRVPAFGDNTLAIYPRSAWTSAGPISGRVSPMNGVNLITFHHTGGQNDGRDVAFLADGYKETIEHLEIVRRYHTLNKGWGDIGYHFAIDRVGRVWQLRSLKYQGAHVKSHDEHNLGIVLLGNFNVQRPTDAQLERIKSFGLLTRTRYQLAITDIHTHQELRPTDCPGRTMQPYMVSIRKQKLI
jgi:hypothetical protein